MQALSLGRHKAFIHLLLRYKPDVMLKDNEGNTAIDFVSGRADLSKDLKGKILFLSSPVMRLLQSKKFVWDFLNTTKIPAELYLNIVEYAVPNIIENIAPEVSLIDKLSWWKTYEKKVRYIEQKAIQEESEQSHLKDEMGNNVKAM